MTRRLKCARSWGFLLIEMIKEGVLLQIFTKPVGDRYCIMQLIVVPESWLHLYFKKRQVGDDDKVEERLKEKENVDDAVKEFGSSSRKLQETNLIHGRGRKKIQKKHTKFYPVDMVQFLGP
ncbi:hypothetical protein MKW98_004695 [Papaver atlanticum]|uniref:Uncharacterized protein n=1 Tax=Papaver atlanticum TaxID=357466 RepID=A0AAD4SQB1_9MAGN|nr:hypothetical protein MKW98_004695 [Papaver atlanticum]